MRTPARILLPAALLFASTATFVNAGGGERVQIEGPARDGRTYTVRTFACGRDVPIEVSGWAEGVVNGERRTLPLALRQKGNAAIFEFQRAWPASGRWMIRLAPAKPSPSASTTVVAVKPDGRLGESKFLWGDDGRHECEARLGTAIRTATK